MIRLRGHLVCATAEEAAAVLAHVALHTQDDFNAHQARTRASKWFEATRGILRDFRVEDLRD